MATNLPRYLLENEPLNSQVNSGKKVLVSVIDKTILNAAKTVKSVYVQAENATEGGVLHSIHPKVKFFALIFMAVIISLVNNLAGQMCISVFVFILVLMGRINILRIYGKILFLAFLFGFLVVFPASLNIITPGKVILNLVSLGQSYQFWIYHIPQNIGFTSEGVQVVGLIFLRVWNSVSFSILIMLTTSFPAFIKSFKLVGVPDTFLMVITLAYKYIFILSRTVEETYLALKSRLFQNPGNGQLRKLISGRVFFMFKRSVSQYENTYYAMVSRGYNGQIMPEPPQPLTTKDYMAIGIVVAFGIAVKFI
ncbi:MAG: hypothetical protein A2W85_06925 [Bacteroidetes bacterium GWF2_41_31]|nr:MAG: hypothetical protein A2W85_06925 [Bacteroidetes bacterium GWF2_41_31]